uniref:DNA polymerase n=1 Tax=Spongospora subterranea TaxID=70186 RepID=A0A0H5QIP4_9EUKA|eukprot:CRZ01186.1 hypothetical protein [Spongospora subterranea]
MALSCDDYFVEANIESILKNWQRPPRPRIANFEQNDLNFQMVDTTVSYENVPAKLQRKDQPTTGPTALLFGVTPAGNSILLHCHGFYPYLYVKSSPEYSDHHARVFKEAIDKAIGENNGFIVSIEPVERRSIWGYTPRDEMGNFLKLTLSHQNIMATVRRILEDVGITFMGATQRFTTYESKVSFDMRFMIDADLVGGGWVQCCGGSYHAVEDPVSSCQLEYDCFYSSLKALPMDDPEWLGLAPLRIMSFDIECAGRPDVFPDADIDPVIQIAVIVKVHGVETPIVNAVLTLRSCSPIAGATVLEFKSEQNLLNAWQKLLVSVDPDILIGYNIVNFDFPYMLNRASKLECRRFGYLSRILKSETKIKNATFSSKAFGTRETKDMNIEGRVQFDIFQIVQREYKLSSYSLNAVCAHFLQQQKEDVHHSIITDLFNGSSETRRRLAVYCLKDAMLPMTLCESLLLLVNYIEMARVTGVPIGFLLTRGQQVKVVSQLHRHARRHGYVIPNRPRLENDSTYEGATVLEPRKGFYSMPIATLDFSSLYPSIMIAHNFCYSTLLSPNQVASLAPHEYVKTPTGDAFVTSEVKLGLLPGILQDLLSARSRAKKDMGAATDPFLKQVLNGRQLALKISANSVYGFTGAVVGSLPCLEISSSVTAFGREMIDKTKSVVEEHFTTDNGYHHNAEVIYGDTDSVFIRFGVETVAEAMDLGKEAAVLVSGRFVKPISLEFEKVYKPFLLMNKKRYAGLYWTNPERYSKMDVKGIETVRRDSCPMAQTVISTCLSKILVDSDVNGAIEYAKQVIGDLLTNNIDMSQLVLTKQLGKDPMKEDQYKAKQAHVELARRMFLRDPTSAPHVGDRVAYVVIKGAKGAKTHEKVEDPIWVLEHGLPIDTQHYLEHQLKLPLERLFEPIIGNVDRLLTGDHTRSVKISTPSAAIGGMMKFAVVRETCMGCKARLGKNESIVCKDCTEFLPTIYDAQIQSCRLTEKLFSQLWTECQRCQGSVHQEVLCSSRDCPIFYRRKKVQKDLEDIRATLNKFPL